MLRAHAFQTLKPPAALGAQRAAEQARLEVDLAQAQAENEALKKQAAALSQNQIGRLIHRILCMVDRESLGRQDILIKNRTPNQLTVGMPF